jgi:septum formation protein
VRLAEAKARAVAARDAAAVVIAADTVVSLGRQLYGKPDDPDDARRMLAELAGRAHRVTTGVAVARGGRVWSNSLSSRVWMRPRSREEIDAYVLSGDPLDKAGAYAIQNEQFKPVAKLVGCRCNVVGFPLGLVAALLREAGVEVSAERACPYRLFAPARCLS